MLSLQFLELERRNEPTTSREVSFLDGRRDREFLKHGELLGRLKHIHARLFDRESIIAT